MRGGVYVYRVRKPSAVYNLPILSRHVGYVGQTSSFWHRHQQHGETQPWADLDPVCYRIGLPSWKWLRLTVEALLIWVLFPVYNVQLNRHNPRRIRPWEASAQRRTRDRGRRPVNIRPVHIFVTIVGLGFAVALLLHWGTGR